MNNMLHFKSITGGVKDVDVSKRIVTGYLSAFGNKDKDGDIIEKGAFKKSILERKDQIFFLNQHQWSQPHGKFNVLKEDAKGLYFESSPFVEGVSYSEDTLKLYDAGIIKEHSIGYIVVKDEYDRKNEARILKEVKLFEGSNVTLGANDQTPFTGFKSMTIDDLNDQCALLYKAIRNGNFRDETFAMLEFALKDLQRQAYILGKNTLTEPSKDTQEEPYEVINKWLKLTRQKNG